MLVMASFAGSSFLAGALVVAEMELLALIWYFISAESAKMPSMYMASQRELKIHGDGLRSRTQAG